MTRDDAKVLWPVIKAWGEGETLQVRDCVNGWVDEGLYHKGRLSFDSDASHYRIKPEPVECYAVMVGDGVIQCYRYWDAAEKHRRGLDAFSLGNARVVKLREVELPRCLSGGSPHHSEAQ